MIIFKWLWEAPGISFRQKSTEERVEKSWLTTYLWRSIIASSCDYQRKLCTSNGAGKPKTVFVRLVQISSKKNRSDKSKWKMECLRAKNKFQSISFNKTNKDNKLCCLKRIKSVKWHSCHWKATKKLGIQQQYRSATPAYHKLIPLTWEKSTYTVTIYYWNQQMIPLTDPDTLVKGKNSHEVEGWKHIIFCAQTNSLLELF